MLVKNINPDFGDSIEFDSLEEMQEAIEELGYMPEDGLKEGRDYEYVYTDEEREAFTEAFIEAADRVAPAYDAALDADTASPWCAPWTWDRAENYQLGTTPEQSAQLYAEKNADELRQIFAMPSRLSLDNGCTFIEVHELPAHKDEILQRWNAIVEGMEDARREAVHAQLAPCTEIEFLQRYLAVSEDDLIIG